MTETLRGRRIHIAGSASKSTGADVVRYAHRVVENVVRGVLERGGGVVTAVGREPRAADGDATLPSLVFDWTVLETAAEVIRAGTLSWPTSGGCPVVVVASEKAEAEIPEERRALWRELREGGAVRLESILPGSRAAALIRERQAEFGDVLVTLGGGTGVEHLTDLYLRERRSVIPLDPPLGASREDGTGGSERLARESRADPRRFLRMRQEFEERGNAELGGIATRNGQEPADDVGRALLGLLERLVPARAFYVRLLNDKHPSFAAVESFFREVVDPVVVDAGLERIEMGTDRSEHGFINVGIFDSLHFARVAVVDVTASRPNCFIELGYALGRGLKVIVTAEEGTELPFDQNAIPCHFWNASTGDDERRKALRMFWSKNIDRPAIVGGA